MPSLDSGQWNAIALFAGYVAFIFWLLWPSNHDCHDPKCSKGPKPPDVV